MKYIENKIFDEIKMGESAQRVHTLTSRSDKPIARLASSALTASLVHKKIALKGIKP